MVAKNPDLKPWEKQPGETCKAFGAFTTYRDLGPRRSLDKTAKELRRKPGGIYDLSARWQWVGRVSAYDMYLDELKRKKHEASIEKMVEDHAKQAQNITALLSTPVEALVKKLKHDPDFAKTFMKDIIDNPQKLMGMIASMGSTWAAAIKIERLSRGEPTDKTRVDQRTTGTLITGAVDPDKIQELMTDPATREAMRLIAEKTSGIKNETASSISTEDDD